MLRKPGFSEILGIFGSCISTALRFGKSQRFLRIDDGSFVFQDQTGGVYRVDLNGKLIWSAARFPPFCQGGICQKQSIGRGQNHGSFLKHGFIMVLVSCCHRWPSLSLFNGTISVPLNWITVNSQLVVFQLYLDIFSKKPSSIGMIGILRDPVATNQYHELVIYKVQLIIQVLLVVSSQWRSDVLEVSFPETNSKGP